MNATSFLRQFGGFLLLAGSALAQQTLSVSPFQLTVAFQRNTPSGTATSRSLDVTNISTRVSVSTSVDSPANVNWLFVSETLLLPTQGATRRVDVTILTGALSPGVYTGRITLSPEGGAAVVVPVSLTVADVRGQNPSPSTLSFVVQRNSPRPPPQALNVSATTGSLTISAGASSTPTSWIQMDPASLNTPGSFNVTVAPGDLAVGDYTGNIVLTATGASGESVANPTVNIPVRLKVVDESKLTVSPSSLSYDFQLGGTTPAARTISVGSSGTSISFTAEVTTPGTGVQWLTAAPLTGSTPQIITVNLQNLASLAAGNYTGAITVRSGADTQTVNVTLRVAVDPLMVVSPGQLTFTFQQGGSAAPRQTLIVSNAGNPTALTAAPVGNSSQWLSVTPSSATTPTPLVVSVNPGTLAPGVYDGAVEVKGSFGNSPFQVPVKLIISGTSQTLLRLGQNQMNFAYQTGSASTTLAQTLSVSSTGAPVNFTPSVTSGASWLSVSPSTSQNTTADVLVSVTPGSLGPGTYSGQISILTTQIQGALPITLPVTLVISAQPLLSVTPPSLSFSVAGSAAPQRQAIRVGSTGNNFAYQASSSVAGGGNWLIIAQSGPNTGTTVEVGVNPIVSEGVGLVTISAPGIENSPVFVPVSLTNTGSTSQLSITPSQLDFVQVVGGPIAPAQTLDITLGQGAGLTNYRIADIRYLNGTGWLKLSKVAGIAPDKVDVSVDATNLAAGRYAATIPFESSVGNRDVVVFFEVRRVVTAFTANPESLTFNSTPGGQNPANQQILVGSSGDPIPFTAEARVPTGTSPWLQVQSSALSTPATLTVSVNPANLAPGAYQGTIVLTGAGGLATRTINVTLNVASAPTPSLTRMVNAASFVDVGAVPGMIVSLLGTNLGPAVGVSASPNASGIFDRQLSNVKVLFDSFEAPILYVSSTQINAVVPYLVAPRLTTRVQVEVNGVRSNGIDLRVATAAPGIFQLNAAGQGAILNQDTTVNGAANPAARDSVIVIYGTGEGQTNPPGVDGTIPGRSTTLKEPVQRVRVRIGGQEAQVLYAGSAPLLISGGLQVNVRIPANINPGSAVPVELIVGDISSQAGVTVAVR